MDRARQIELLREAEGCGMDWDRLKEINLQLTEDDICRKMWALIARRAVEAGILPPPRKPRNRR